MKKYMYIRDRRYPKLCVSIETQVIDKNCSVKVLFKHPKDQMIKKLSKELFSQKNIDFNVKLSENYTFNEIKNEVIDVLVELQGTEFTPKSYKKFVTDVIEPRKSYFIRVPGFPRKS